MFVADRDAGGTEHHTMALEDCVKATNSAGSAHG